MSNFRHFFWLAPLGAAGALGGAFLVIEPDSRAVLAAGLGLGIGAAALLAKAWKAARPGSGASAEMHQALIEALATAIDAKHDPSGKRLLRRRVYATALAEAVGVSAREVESVRLASLLVDIGQLAVPDHILGKPGPLSVEEFHKVRLHPLVSADLIAEVPLPEDVTAFVRSHHERWDGKGYPEGLAAEQIPIGARVLSVVDCYDALVSDRPYRDRLSREAALAVLREEAGKSLDPSLVERFTALLPTLGSGTAPERAVGASLDSIASAGREDVALFEISQAMSAGLGVTGTAQLLARKLRRVIPYSSAALYLFDAESRTFRSAFTEGVEADTLAGMLIHADGGMFGQALREQRAVANGDPSPYVSQPGASTSLRSSIVCPLYGEQQEVVGALAVYHVTPGCYTTDECRLLEMVARQAGPVVSHALQLARAREEALTDALTGLPNTRFLWMHLTQELARAARQGSKLALLLIDVDDFKSVNDTQGHTIGDLALRELSQILQRAVRPYDVCARYGGDEFVVMMPECGREEAEERMRDLQERIAAHEIRLPDGRTFRLGASIGAAVFPRDGDSSEALLATADARMYQDKEQRWRIAGRPDGAPAVSSRRPVYRF